MLSEGKPHSLQLLFLSLTVSLIAAEGAIANVVGMSQMNPPVKDLRMSPLACFHPRNADQ